ncbi:MAG: hypothetical protein Q9M13_01745 [Mariprofundales bacterium]|nr:hypothetical protein [Mariprofundales bacterium]
MNSWQVGGCSVTLHAPPNMVTTAAPLFALYPTIDKHIHTASIAFVGSQQRDSSWRIECNSELLWQDSELGNTVAALELALYRRVLELTHPALCSIHAAAIAIEQHAIICAGVSGAGKSSLCTQALLAGASYLSDEFALIDESGAIHPFPRPLQWEHTTHPAFTEESMINSTLFRRSSYRFSDHNGATRESQLWLPERLQRTPLPLTVVILPRFTPQSTTIITPLARSSAIMQLADLIQQAGEIKNRLQTLHRRIPDNTRFYSLQFGSVADGWRRIQQLI